MTIINLHTNVSTFHIHTEKKHLQISNKQIIFKYEKTFAFNTFFHIHRLYMDNTRHVIQTCNNKLKFLSLPKSLSFLIYINYIFTDVWICKSFTLLGLLIKIRAEDDTLICYGWSLLFWVRNDANCM